MSEAPLHPLRADGLSFAFREGSKAAVRDVTLAPRAGAVTVLAGPNGAGKSTVLRLLAGLLEPDRGEVTVHDEDGDARPLRALDARARARRIGFVPQALEAIPATTVTDFVEGGRYAWLDPWRRPGTGDRAAIHQALDACGLAALGDRDLLELSGGERQRCLVARTLAQDPGVVLCDEPTASLDFDHALAVCDLLANLASQGRAVVLVTHELDLAAQYGDELVLMQEGRTVASGTPDQVLREDVLAPVYGDRLHVTRLPDGRPLVVPRR